MKLRVLLFSAAISLLTLAALPVAAQSPTSNSVAYNGFSFSYDSALAGHIDIDEFAGDPATLEQPGGPEVKHVQFAISSAETTPSIFDAPLAIRVYNTADFASYPNQTTQLQNLQTLLGAKTDLNPFMTSTDTTGASNLPFVPILPAAQVIRARAQYISTPSVSGISYITAYRQDVSPFVGSEFFYTFQGISSDGTRYVSAIFKLNTALFPAEIPSDFNMDTFNAGYIDYIQQSVTTLNSGQPTDFTPSLPLLDAVVQSFSFVPSVAAQPTIQPPVSSDPTLGGLTTSNWILASYGTAEAPIAVLPEAPINLLFTQDGISGSAGCNTYFGQFHYDINVLGFSAVGNTLMACTDPAVMTQESDYLNALRTATSYVIDNGVLKITYQDGVLTFNGETTTPTPSAPATPIVNTDPTLGGLAGVQWTLVSYGAAAAPVAALPDAPVTADFTSQGISGSAGCNQYSGTFVYNNNTLTFSPLVATQMACTDNVMTQENAYLTALQSATGYQIANGQLQISYPDGVLVFKSGV